MADPLLEQTILAAIPGGVLRVAVSLGWDREQLARDAGIDLARLADPDARVPVADDLALWNVLSRRPMGLDIGERFTLAETGVVGFAMLHGHTVREALAWMQRYRALLHPALVPAIEERSTPAGELLIFSKPVPPPFQHLREPVYAQAASIVASLRGLTGRPQLYARYVAFPMTRPNDAERQEQWFACPVSWGGPLMELAFDASVLELTLPLANPNLSSYLARRADELHAALPSETTDADRVRREVAALLAFGEPAVADVAKRLAMSVRTLHRRLQDESTSFSAIVESLRRERAELLLADATTSASQVAMLLGYAEPATFFRAFRRWTGMTPSTWRQRAVQVETRT
jgi:AraC-like DNA-binding protein